MSSARYQSTPIPTFTPTAFETPQSYMKINGSYVQLVGDPELKLSLFNIAIVSLAALFTFGFILFATGDKWWYSRTYKMKPLNIKMQKKMPLADINARSLSQPNRRLLSSLNQRVTTRGWSLFPKNIRQSTSYVSDAYCLAFLDALKNKTDDQLPRLAFNRRDVLTEQIAFDALFPSDDEKKPLTEKLNLIAGLHDFTVRIKMPLESLECLETTFQDMLTREYEPNSSDYYCLCSQDTSQVGHLLMVFFQFQGSYYVFDPAQGILKLAGKPSEENKIETHSNDESPLQLFSAYACTQLHDRVKDSFFLIRLAPVPTLNL